MKVCYYVSYFDDYAGAQQCLATLVRNLPDGISPTVIFPGEGVGAAAFRDAGVPVMVVEADPWLNTFERQILDTPWMSRMTRLARVVPAHVARLRRVFRELRPDIVHCNDTRGMFTAAVAARSGGVPVVRHVRGVNELRSSPVMERLVSSLASRTICVAGALVGSLRTQRGVSVVHCGIDDETPFADVQAEGEIEQAIVERGFDESTVRVMTVSSLVPFKGHHHLVEALGRLVSADPDMRNRVVWFVLGRASRDLETQYLSMLRDRVDHLGLTRNIVWLGWRPDGARWVSSSDVVVLPTVDSEVLTLPDGHKLNLHGTEGFPHAVLEGMRAGKAVIATDVAGVREQIEHGSSGLIVQPSDPDALARALHDVLRDASSRSQLGQQARQRSKAFTVGRMVDATVAVYEELAAERQSRKTDSKRELS